jgi:thiol-disulfide isomerase/thioredoxin
MTKKSNFDTEEVIEVSEINENSPWYYFYSVGCAFCTKLEPIIDELNKDGYEILKLDLSNGDNKKLANELSQEYNKNCGTPWLINADTGNHICGFRDKDIILKWLDGEDIPPPPQMKGQMPQPPFHGAKKKEEKAWKTLYNEWLNKNKEIPNLLTAKQILERPRPKSKPPLMPNPTATDNQIEGFKKTYQKWYEENKHLPNRQTVDQIMERVAQARIQPQYQMQILERKVNSLESKLDKMMKHFGVK